MALFPFAAYGSNGEGLGEANGRNGKFNRLSGKLSIVKQRRMKKIGNMSEQEKQNGKVREVVG